MKADAIPAVIAKLDHARSRVKTRNPEALNGGRNEMVQPNHSQREGSKAPTQLEHPREVANQAVSPSPR